MFLFVNKDNTSLNSVRLIRLCELHLLQKFKAISLGLIKLACFETNVLLACFAPAAP